MMIARRPLLGLAATALAAPALPSPVLAQTYPDRSIRWIVPFPAGGATDLWARLVAEPMAATLGQPIVIENRGGAGSLLGSEAVAKATPDGYTLMFTITSLVQGPVVLKRWPYDPHADFAPIGRMGGTPLVFCTQPDVPVNNLREFAEWARRQSGKSFGSYGTGSTGHAFGQLFVNTEKLDMTHVGYRGEAPLLTDMLGGRVVCAFHSMAGAGDNIRSGRLKPLGVLGGVRVPSMPNLPTFMEQGYSNRFSWDGFIGLLAPSRVPEPILAKQADAFRAAMQLPAVLNRLREIDTIPGYMGPAEFGALIRRCRDEWQALADEIGLQADG